MVIKSYSKINLTLKTNSKSINGLHEIQSLYCWINLFDKIKIYKIKKNRDRISFNGPYAKLINNRNNSVFKTLKKLRELNLISNYYSVKVTKNIPVFAGLGGGTSNAAFILKYLLKNKINKNLLEKFESLIGSDFRLFFKKQGFLKDLQSIIEIKKKQKFYFTLIQPKIIYPTKEIYSNVKKISKKKKFDKNLIKSRNKLLEYLSKNGNDLQFIVEKKYPLIKNILTDLKNEKGCYLSRMTGSGSVCYGLFMDPIVAKKALHKLKKKYPKFWISLAKTV
tara:strand:+ start:864 stop:1700 length:837 start_codon:yes stop_codon:yes gene_type:complete